MEAHIGKVLHYYSHLNVAVICLQTPLKVGDYLHFLGYTTDFTQPIFSMEVNHRKIATSESCDEVAVQVVDYVRKGDFVYRVVEDIGEMSRSI